MSTATQIQAYLDISPTARLPRTDSSSYGLVKTAGYKFLP